MDIHLPGIHLRTLVSGKETDGAVVIFQETSGPEAGPPLHAHDDQTEVFHVVEGHYRFQVDDRIFELKTGGCAVAPRGSAHAFKNIGDKPGELRVEMIPAGSAEAFFEGLPGVPREEVPEYFAKFGNRLLGPPGL